MLVLQQSADRQKKCACSYQDSMDSLEMLVELHGPLRIFTLPVLL